MRIPFLLSLALLSVGCRARSTESAELVLRGSIAESSETVQLDPVFLARQRQVESRFFGFDDEKATDADADVPSKSDDVDVAVEPHTIVPPAATFGGLTLQWPLNGNVTSPYGMRRGRLHAGLDIKGDKGDPIYAAADGQVLTSKRRNAYGKVVIVGHENDHQTLYAHMTAFAVREGQYVRAGELVGYVGATGRATGFHLHFETRVNGGVPQDPMRFLPNVRGTKARRVSMQDAEAFVKQVTQL
ncbi:MAG: M23 family metallopeptidase [Silvanigrellales bacterium]|nr:M23 family metallopeptidase [Silvanigrellales bacterium]